MYGLGYPPDGKVHGANMGPTWVLSAPDGPMLAPWTLLSGELPYNKVIFVFVSEAVK